LKGYRIKGRPKKMDGGDFIVDKFENMREQKELLFKSLQRHKSENRSNDV